MKPAALSISDLILAGLDMNDDVLDNDNNLVSPLSRLLLLILARIRCFPEELNVDNKTKIVQYEIKLYTYD